MEQAADHIQQAMDGLRRAGRQDYLPLGLLARAAFRLHTGDHAGARHDLDEALALATRCGFRLHEADAHLGHTRLAIAERDPAAALGHLAKARAIIHATEYHRRDDELGQLEAEARTMASTLPVCAPALLGWDIRNPFYRTYDIAILCALRTPELEKVLATGKQPWKKLDREAGELTTYRTTTFTTSTGRSFSVVAAAPSQMGMTAAAVLASKMVSRFRPKLVVMVGIAAGVNRDTQGFGDILAPDTTLDYGAGKLTANDGKPLLRPDPNPISIAPILRARLGEWTLEHEPLARIRQQWPGKKPSTVLKLHVGPLGSGAAVVTVKDVVVAAQDHFRKLIGLEMEAYGVHLACQEAVHPPPMFLCMKSICDFAGPDKDDAYQEYAAYTAAELCHLFLTEEWDTLFPP